MRTAFIDSLVALAAEDERVWLLCGDLGYSVLERFADRFPNRFVNVGVAEQNMTGVAAGIAMAGKIVYTYSIANFPIMRCLEQIRNDVCYHNLPVKIVAVGGGLAYGSAGYSHHGTEDLAVMRVLPNMSVLVPSDPIEARLAARAAATHPGPCYVRLGKAGEPLLHVSEPAPDLRAAILMRPGDDAAIFATGSMVQPSLAAAEALLAEGKRVRVYSVPSIQPLDAETIRTVATQVPRIVSVEEHGVGGLGSAIAEILAGEASRPAFRMLRLPSRPISIAGTQEQLRASVGLGVHDIVRSVIA